MRLSNQRSIESKTTLWLEIFTRGILSFVFLQLEDAEPFVRKISSNELWLYKNPPTDSYVPTSVLFPVVFTVPTVFLIVHFVMKKNKKELAQGLLALSLAFALNGVITNVIKITVGRPRPDFFYRCFPDGKVDSNELEDIARSCNGESHAIRDGRKSFPSGHSSFSFCGFGFLSLWLCGKLGVFRGFRSEGWRLVLAGLPLLAALMISLSRTCDYHHHWQDVLVGSLIGLLMAYVCYRQYYPRLSSPYCHVPYLLIASYYQEFNVTNGRSREADPEQPMDNEMMWI